MTSWKLIDFESLDKNDQELVRESVAARQFSYAPYSKFKVGAALRSDDKTISRGCNVENASFPVSTCAERVAICRAVSEGKIKFEAIAVAADLYKGEIASPCGMCRQCLAEFGDMTIYLSTPDMKKILRTSVCELLPIGFGLNEHNDKNL